MTGPPASPPQSPPTHQLIFLIGYRGSGKTRVAGLLAKKLGWQWLDADALLASTELEIAVEQRAVDVAGDGDRQPVVIREPLAMCTSFDAVAGGKIVE